MVTPTTDRIPLASYCRVQDSSSGLDIKALKTEGKKLDGKTFTTSGEVLHVKAMVGPKGDVLDIKALKDSEK